MLTVISFIFWYFSVGFVALNGINIIDDRFYKSHNVDLSFAWLLWPFVTIYMIFYHGDKTFGLPGRFLKFVFTRVRS